MSSPPVFRDERKLRDESVRCADRVDEIGLDRPAECLLVDLPEGGLLLIRGLGPDLHAARSSAGSASSERNVSDSSGCRFGPPSSTSSSSKIACAWRSRDGACHCLRSHAYSLVETIVGVEDAADRELWRDGAVPVVLLQAERHVVAAFTSGSGRAACPDRTRSHLPRRDRRAARGSADACLRRRSPARRARSRVRAA